MLPKVPVSHWWRVCAEALERVSRGEGKCARGAMKWISFPFSIPSTHLPTVSEWSSQAQYMCPTITGLIHPWQLSISFGKFLYLLKRRCSPVWIRNLFKFLSSGNPPHKKNIIDIQTEGHVSPLITGPSGFAKKIIYLKITVHDCCGWKVFVWFLPQLFRYQHLSLVSPIEVQLSDHLFWFKIVKTLWGCIYTYIKHVFQENMEVKDRVRIMVIQFSWLMVWWSGNPFYQNKS